MRLTRWTVAGPLLAVALLIALFLASCGGKAPQPTPTPTPSPTPTTGPGSSVAYSPSPVLLPKDDAPHADATVEWWYYNGHITTLAGAPYGFHFVVFQVRPPGLGTVGVAHVALTDPQQRTYITDQRLTFGTPIAQAADSFAFTIGGWTLQGGKGRDAFQADAGAFQLGAVLQETRPSVLHGGSGYVSYGDGSGSYYYSRTRMSVSGSLTLQGAIHPVQGEAWFDHQWGQFQPQAIGWDWFALQLEDGSDVMLYTLRDVQGNALSDFGTLVSPDGNAKTLSGADFSLTPGNAWTSPKSGIVYPVDWMVTIPSKGLTLKLTPLMPESEFDGARTTGNSYWEGEVSVSGSATGRGFVEMVRFPPASPQK